MFETDETPISPAMRARDALLDWNNPSKPLPTTPNYSRYSGKTKATKEISYLIQSHLKFLEITALLSYR